MLDQKNQEQITLMAYRDGHLAEIDPNKDLFLKQLVEADIKDRDVESNPDERFVEWPFPSPPRRICSWL